jgi:hypothetical protein
VSTPDDIRDQRVARLERLAVAGEEGVVCLLGLIKAYGRDVDVVERLTDKLHKLIRDVEVATYLQFRIEAGWRERAEPEGGSTPESEPGPRAPGPPAIGLRMPGLTVPADFEARFEDRLIEVDAIAEMAAYFPDQDPTKFPRESERDYEDPKRFWSAGARRDTS